MRTALTYAAITIMAAIPLGAVSGCIVESHHDTPPATEIDFEELRNLGYMCGGPLTGWTVSNRQTGDQGTAGCEQPIFFEGIVPGQTYTFDVTGYSGQQLCWQGSCDVYVPGTGTTIADCSGQITHLCGL